MKKLALLLFTILILGCGTETPVVEEPPIIEELPPTVMEPEPIGHPLIADGTVKHGQVNVDPESVGDFCFAFKKPIYKHWVTLREKDGKDLGWYSFTEGEWDRTHILCIQSARNPLQYDTEYVIEISTQNSDCKISNIVIQFRTKPQRPIAGRPAPVIQERIPAAALGEHFRADRIDTHIVDGDVPFRGEDIDPEPLNANGIQFKFNCPIRKYKVDLRVKGGPSLGWLPRGLVENNMGERIQIMPAEGAPLLEFDTEYIIDISVLDFRCLNWEFERRFLTKPK